MLTRYAKLLEFFPEVEAIAQRSRDTTKVGAMILGPDLETRSSGYNGFPRKVHETDDRKVRPLKYRFACHAEENAIAQAARIGVSVKGCTILVTELYPCTTCCRLIIQSGIARVVTRESDRPQQVRWAEEAAISEMMFKEAGVEVIRLTP